MSDSPFVFVLCLKLFSECVLWLL